MKQSKFIYLTIALLIVVFVISGAVINEHRHQNRLYLVVEKEILEAVNKCRLEKKCQDETVTLQFLYDNYYLVEQSNPITKKKYDSNLSINLNSNKITWLKNK